MAGALFYLTVCSLRNAVRSWVRRLREPRYGVGLVVGVGYFYSIFIRRRPSGRGGLGSIATALTGQYHDIALVGIATFLLAATAVSWVFPGSARTALKFLPAEVQFLFSAPITRRQLVHYKLLRAALRPVLTSLIITLASRPVSVASGLTIFAGVLVLFETLSLYPIGVALRRRPGQRTLTFWLPGALLGAAILVVGSTVALNWTALSHATNGRAFIEEVARLGTTGAGQVALLPFLALVRLPLSPTVGDFIISAPTALLLLAGSYVWALRGDGALEDGSAAQTADEVASSLATPSAAAMALRTPFVLSPVGPAETALLWKNIISVGRLFSVKLVVRLLPLLVFAVAGLVSLSLSPRGGGVTAAVALICVVIAGYAILFGPQLARNDLRQDLAHLAVLKAWPLRGAVVVRGEVLAPAVILSTIACLAIVSAGLLSSGLGFAAGRSVLDRLSFTVGAMLIAPGLILTQIVIHNAIALMFPAWAGVTRTHGVDVAGQRMMMMAGVMLLLIVACLPAVLAAGLIGLAIRFALGVLPVIVPAAVALVVLMIECGMATEALGSLFERTDIGAIQP